MRTTEARDAQESALPCALSQARQNGERMGIAPPLQNGRGFGTIAGVGRSEFPLEITVRPPRQQSIL